MNAKRKWAKYGFAALAAAGLLVTAGMLYASGGAEVAHGAAGAAQHGGAHGSVTPEKLKDLLWRTLNFAGLVFILVKFLSKPLANALRSRREGIQEQFEELEARRAEAEQFYKDYEAKLSGIDDEVKKIVDGAIAQAEVEKQRIIADAHRAAGDIKRQAEMAVQHELAAAKHRLQADIAEQAAVMAETLIHKNLQPADQDRLVAEYLDRVGGLQ